MVEDIQDWEELANDEVLERQMARICISNAGRTNNSGAPQILRRPASSGSPSHQPNNGQPRRSSDLNSAINAAPFVPRAGPQVTLEDNTRTQFVAPVRILRREAKPQQTNGETKPVEVKQGRSYHERMAEYSKARERILGSAEPVDTSPPPSLNASPQELTPTHQSKRSPTGSNGTSSTNNSATSTVNNVSTTVPSKADVPTVRQPTGPDGTRGFKR